jgi:hypothetical protein
MDIRHSGHNIYPAVITTEGSLRVPASQRSFDLPLLSTSEEIIDCVAIRSDNYQPTLLRKTPYPVRTDQSLSLQTKGKWIDVWI